MRKGDSTKAGVIVLELRNKEPGEYWRKINELNHMEASFPNTVNG